MKKLLLLLLFPLIVNAGEIDIGDEHQLQYSGYVGYRQLFSDVNTNKTFNNSTPEIGLNAIYTRGNFQIFNQFRFGSHVDNILVYNFAQYTFNIAEETNLTLRAGKIRHEAGLYNTTRIHPRTRQGIIMPQAIYWDAFNELLTSGTGVEIIFDYKSFQFSYTIDDPAVIDKVTTKDIFYGPYMNSIHTGFGSHQNAALTYSPKDMPFMLKSTWTYFNFGNDTSFVMDFLKPNLANKDQIAEVLTFGGEYKFSDFLISAEMMAYRSFDTGWTELGELNYGISVSGVYEINENVSIRLNYNEYESKLKKAAEPEKPWTAYTKDLNLGVNYHDGPWMVRVEGHHMNGNLSISPKDFIGTNIDDYKEWWLIGMQVTYSF